MNFRLVIAIMFLILLLAFGIFQEIYLDKVFSQFDSMLEELTNPPDGKYDLAKTIQVEEWWDKQHSKMEMFLPHLPLNEIAATLGEFKGYVKTEDYESSTAMLTRLMVLSESLSEMSGVRIGNIL